jgi:hypothetical protein
MSSLDKFEPFPKLPPEIRIKIWNESLKPRVVELVFSWHTERFYPCAPPPALLHTSREAREIALKRYELVKLDRHRTHPVSVYIDFSDDIVYFGPLNESVEFTDDGAYADDNAYHGAISALGTIFRCCRHVAFQEYFFSDESGNFRLSFLWRFRTLQDLRVVHVLPLASGESHTSFELDGEVGFVSDSQPFGSMSWIPLRLSEISGLYGYAKEIHYAYAIRGLQRYQLPTTDNDSTTAAKK